MGRKHFSSMAVSYSPDDGNGITDKKETVTLVEGPQVHQPDGGWSVFGSTFRSIRIVKWLLVSIALVCAFVVFYHWFVFQAISNVEHNGEMVAGSRITNNDSLGSNVELEFEADDEDGEMHTTTILPPNTITSSSTTSQESVIAEPTTTTPEPTTTTTEVPTTTTTQVPTTTTTPAPTTTTTPAPTITTTQVPTTTTRGSTTTAAEGNLEIKVIRALLPKTDFWDDTDPFVKVYVANRKLGQTLTIKNNRYPHWNKYFTANAVKVDSWIKFEVYDVDVTRDVLIGETKISIIDTITDDKLGKEIKLDVCNKDECQIIVQVKWTWL